MKHFIFLFFDVVWCGEVSRVRFINGYAGDYIHTMYMQVYYCVMKEGRWWERQRTEREEMREKFPPYATDVYSSGLPPSFEDFSVFIQYPSL